MTGLCDALSLDSTNVKNLRTVLARLSLISGGDLQLVALFANLFASLSQHTIPNLQLNARNTLKIMGKMVP